MRLARLRPGGQLQPAGVDEKRQLRVATVNVASGQVSGPSLVTPIGAVSARSTHSSEPQQTVAKGG